MIRAGRTIAALLLLLALLPGCWNRRELNDLGILVGTAIDKVGDQYRLTAQIVKPGEVTKRKSPGTSAPVTLYQSTAPTLFTAFRKLTEISPRKVYGAHIRVLVLGESLAKEGVTDAIDLLIRDPEVRSDFYVMIARDTSAESVLRVMTPLENIPANKLFHSLDVSSKAWAPTTTVTLEQLMEKLIGEGINPVLTGVRLVGDAEEGNSSKNTEKIDPSAKLRLTGLAVMRKDRLVGWLNEVQSKGYNYITDQVTSTAGYVKCSNGGLLTLETIRTHTKMKGKMVNGKPVIDIHMVDESNIAEVACEIDLDKPGTIRELEEKQRSKKIALMKQAVEVVKRKYGVDIFGFGQAVYRADPRAWSRLKKDWDSHFQDVQVRYEVDIHIRKIGMMGRKIQIGSKE
ncbi:Ger(x)C family spore germination protein [Paenibacillus sp. GYB003]|uniref:Ger(x)C family spore germination protein n=1 Tax=Paenibacillus sp. GYB003 TaxID=2994392 RepID=UPI002F9663F4